MPSPKTNQSMPKVTEPRSHQLGGSFLEACRNCPHHKHNHPHGTYCVLCKCEQYQSANHPNPSGIGWSEHNIAINRSSKGSV